MWQFILNLLFPRRCVSCGRVGKYICPRCASRIRYVNTQVCPVCERQAIGGATHPRCHTKYSLDGLTSFFVYDGPIKKAIKLLKYKFVTDLAQQLVILLGASPTNFSIASAKDNPYISGRSTLTTLDQDLVVRRHSKIVGLRPLEKEYFEKGDASSLNKYVLTPVPLHWRRENWRGFNQSEVLGKLIAQKLGVKFMPDLLIRTKFTKPQVELRGKGRQENIQDAFEVNSHSLFAIRHLNILIFDDVWTTGATLKSCGKVLKQARARKVWGMTLAR